MFKKVRTAVVLLDYLEYGRPKFHILFPGHNGKHVAFQEVCEEYKLYRTVLSMIKYILNGLFHNRTVIKNHLFEVQHMPSCVVQTVQTVHRRIIVAEGLASWWELQRSDNVNAFSCIR